MSKETEYLGLFQYTSEDDETPFNIDRALNQNWEKIDNALQQASSYTKFFAAEDWTAEETAEEEDTGEDGTGEKTAGACTITIPAATHNMTGNAVVCKALVKMESSYRENLWAAMETYATIEENGDIVLHYPESSGYEGAAILNVYQL